MWYHFPFSPACVSALSCIVVKGQIFCAFKILWLHKVFYNLCDKLHHCEIDVETVWEQQEWEHVYMCTYVRVSECFVRFFWRRGESSTSCSPWPRHKQSALRGQMRPQGLRVWTPLQSLLERSRIHIILLNFVFKMSVPSPNNQEL